MELRKMPKLTRVKEPTTEQNKAKQMKQKTDIFHAISFSNSNYAHRLYSTTIIIHSKLDDTCPNKYPYFNFTMSTTNGIMRTCLLGKCKMCC